MSKKKKGEAAQRRRLAARQGKTSKNKNENMQMRVVGS
jgi:hypothetical protein